MEKNEKINGWTFEEAVKNASNLMEVESNMYKWDVLRHLLDFTKAYREELKEYHAIGTPEDLKTMKEHGSFTGVELANIAAMQMKLKEYEAIGVPEECLVAVEKQKGEEPTAVLGTFGGTDYECKNCGSDVRYGDKYCRWCGQKLDWSDEE